MNMTERCEIFLYSAARVQLVQEKIIPLLKEGYFILADRYVDSTTAYQGYGRGLDLQMVEQINQAATFGLLPGTTFTCACSPKKLPIEFHKAAVNWIAWKLPARISTSAFFKDMKFWPKK